MKTPILLIVFNRPDTTMVVLDAIRKAQPLRLYVACDGPREGREDEASVVHALRQDVLHGVDWDCEITTLFRDVNLGCKRAVSSALDWFFEQEEEGIILEDDCVPAASFFGYCEELLEKYRHAENVMCISGDNFLPADLPVSGSYYFSKLVHIWGWASWRRAWKGYQVEISTDWAIHGAALVERLFPGSKNVRSFWNASFESVATGGVNTWDTQWVYHIWRHGGICCVPAKNQISNIGFGGNATHTHDAGHHLANLPIGELSFPLEHPRKRKVFHAGDAWEMGPVFGIAPDRTRLQEFVRVAKRMVRNLLRR